MKIVVNMLSKADSVDGQGVGSAYLEQVNLIKTELNDTFEVRINSHKKADIIHIHSVNFPYYLSRKRGAVKVCYCHFLPETLEGSIKLPKFAFWVFKKYVVSFYKKADYLVVVNPIFIPDLIKLGVKEDRIKYIPNFVSHDDFYLEDENKILETKKKYNIDPNKFIVLGCGQVQTRKGVLDFVEVARRNPDKLFVWCGGFSFKAITDGYKELKEIVDNPPYENLKFLGIIPRSEMNDMFNMSDCLFMPSFNELFPMSILEAVNSLKPVVLRNLDLYKDVLFDKYVCGEGVDDFDNLIKKLATDKEFYQECQQKSKYISDYYTKENVSKIWKDFYLDVYNKNPKRRKA